MHSTLILALLLVSIATHQQFDNSVRVTYGSLIKLINPSSSLMVHSHDVFFGRGGVMSVTGYHIDDLGSYWQFSQAYQKAVKTYEEPVLCGDTITISSAIEGYFLRAQDTQFGLTTELLPMVHGMKKQNLDEKINWELHCVGKDDGEEVRYNDQLRFKNQVSGKYVSLDPIYAYTEANCGRGCAIAGQLELHAIDSADQTTSVFQVRTGLTFDPEFVAQEVQTMSKAEELKAKYVADADMMASKSRFGFFTLPPSHTAAHTDFANNTSHRDADGKVITQPPNIHSGVTSQACLQKNYFSYIPSAFHGSEYQDPGKAERKQHAAEAQKQEGKDQFRPVKLNKTLMSASYEYISPYDPKKDNKNHRGADGKVITQPSNVLISPQSKITYSQNKKFKYTECPPQTTKSRKTEQIQNKHQPFKTGDSHKPVFSNNQQTFFDTNIAKPEPKKSMPRVASHQGPFKPSCSPKGAPFTPFVYTEQGNGKSKVVKAEKKERKNDPFRLIKVEHNSKPCPSISLSKINMLRVCR